MDRADQQITVNPLIKPQRPYIYKTLKKILGIYRGFAVSVADQKSNDLISLDYVKKCVETSATHQNL
jgi:hypothetical protein